MKSNAASLSLCGLGYIYTRNVYHQPHIIPTADLTISRTRIEEGTQNSNRELGNGEQRKKEERRAREVGTCHEKQEKWALPNVPYHATPL